MAFIAYVICTNENDITTLVLIGLTDLGSGSLTVETGSLELPKRLSFTSLTAPKALSHPEPHTLCYMEQVLHVNFLREPPLLIS